MGQIIALGTYKGGSGKSTVATHLAAQYAHDGYDTLLIDGDNNVQSSANWAADRGEIDPPVPRVSCVQKTGKGFGQELKAIAQKYDRVVVDTPGADGPELQGALRHADFLIVPLRPSQYDAWAMEYIAESIAGAAESNEKLAAGIVVVAAPTNPNMKDLAEIRSYAEHYSDTMGLFSARLSYRAAWWRHSGDGMTVFEAGGKDDPAAFEWRRFYKELTREIASLQEEVA